VAEYACRVTPMPVLNWVLKDEAEYRQRCKRGTTFTSPVDRQEHTSSPELEYEWYRQNRRPFASFRATLVGFRKSCLRRWAGWIGSRAICSLRDTTSGLVLCGSGLPPMQPARRNKS